jgi:Holliday junction resolvasome RuvABC endonuclease subunit
MLAVDIGTKTGLAIKSQQGGITVSTLKLKVPKTGEPHYLKYAEDLEKIFLKHKIEMVFFEQVMRHVGTFAAHRYGGLGAILCMVSQKLNVKKFIGVHCTTIKKHITGSGKASKEDVQQAVLNKFQLKCTFDEADALALLDYCIQKQSVI